MGLAEIALHFVQNITSLALALVLANTDAVQAGQVTVRHTLAALAFPIEARRAFAGVGCNATSSSFAGTVEKELNIISHLSNQFQYSRLANGIAASFHLRVARVAAALTRRSAFSVLAILAHWGTTAIGIGAISL